MILSFRLPSLGEARASDACQVVPGKAKAPPAAGWDVCPPAGTPSRAKTWDCRSPSLRDPTQPRRFLAPTLLSVVDGLSIAARRHSSLSPQAQSSACWQQRLFLYVDQTVAPPPRTARPTTAFTRHAAHGVCSSLEAHPIFPASLPAQQPPWQKRRPCAPSRKPMAAVPSCGDALDDLGGRQVLHGRAGHPCFVLFVFWRWSRAAHPRATVALSRPPGGSSPAKRVWLVWLSHGRLGLDPISLAREGHTVVPVVPLTRNAAPGRDKGARGLQDPLRPGIPPRPAPLPTSPGRVPAQELTAVLQREWAFLEIMSRLGSDLHRCWVQCP